jgi:hypothetical protein
MHDASEHGQADVAEVDMQRDALAERAQHEQRLEQPTPDQRDVASESGEPTRSYLSVCSSSGAAPCSTSRPPRAERACRGAVPRSASEVTPRSSGVRSGAAVAVRLVALGIVTAERAGEQRV